MHQSFSGSSRRPRQVNLSGRQNPNPFASSTAGARSSAPGSNAFGANNALASAQKDREARQIERARTHAATLVQKTWRGNTARRRIRDLQRAHWDELEECAAPAEDGAAQGDGDRMEVDTAEHNFADDDGQDDGQLQQLPPYRNQAEATSQLLTLLRFLDLRQKADFVRLSRFYLRLRSSAECWNERLSNSLAAALDRLQSRCLDIWSGRGQRLEDIILARNIARYIFRLSGWRVVHNISRYFGVLVSTNPTKPLDPNFLVEPLTSVAHGTSNGSVVADARPEAPFGAHKRTGEKISQTHDKRDSFGQPSRPVDYTRVDTCYLESSDPESMIYEAFIRHIMTLPNLRARVRGEESLARLAHFLDRTRLAETMVSVISKTGYLGDDLKDPTVLLGHFIFFYRLADSSQMLHDRVPDVAFVDAVSSLITAILNLQKSDPSTSAESSLEAADEGKDSIVANAEPFIGQQILTLVNEKSILALLSQIIDAEPDENSRRNGDIKRPGSSFDSHANTIANYILTLIRVFPKHANEIRMWLYLGEPKSEKASESSGTADSAVRYFFLAAQGSNVYRSISRDPREAIPLLKAARTDPSRSSEQQHSIDEDWCPILIFVELYLFALSIMDDEEFFARADPSKTATMAVGNPNALLLAEVQSLVTFLKNLGFTMYYYAPEIAGTTTEEAQQDLKSLFGGPSAKTSRTEGAKGDSKSEHLMQIGGLRGTNVEHLKKDLVVPLLRAIYERDSRRKFLPDGHWLMTSRFDMTKFVDAVVEEEERRNKVQEADDDDSDDEEMEDAYDASPRLIGTARTQQQRRIHQLQREQRKASRRRYLQAVAPRLEILQNMPFLIPFKTRVQIFRRFIHLDQFKRRNGAVDPELWRLSLRSSLAGGRDSLQRHHAKIRREHEFEDAYEQFYDLGADLKEPIQITFVDRFDTEEMGIDGGGVTKEFLTSVTNQAFSPRDGIQLFSENENHFLYPNPSALDEQRQLLREAGFKETMPTYKAQINELLQQYEFLGRIIGKCLYEGILIDVGFAGFFLLKWSLTSSKGSTQRENGYIANINDLRDFDEGLYQGLIKLKNYPGNVEDFALNFTITDTISIPSSTSSGTAKNNTITRELAPNGSSIAVTNANRPLYLSYVVRHRLQNQPYLQTSAFLRGLASIIQPSWLSMFNQSELQTLVGGAAASISVPDLRRSTEYGGVYQIGDDGQEHPSVKLFWDVLELDFSEEDRRKLLKFVTSTPRAPLLGFASLNPRFSIRDAGADEARLPSTSTCVNLLKLPRYTKRETCRRKLLQAVNAGAGFDLS